MSKPPARWKRILLSSLFTALFAGPAVGETIAADVSFDNTGTNYTATDVQTALEEVDAAVLGDTAHFVDLEIAAPTLNGTPHGVHWPITDPANTEIFVGLLATDEGGSLAQTNNVFCLAYNFDDCGDTRIDASEHA